MLYLFWIRAQIPMVPGRFLLTLRLIPSVVSS